MDSEKKKKILSIALLLAIIASGVVFIAYIEYPIETVTIEVDFAELQVERITPVWNTLNIWDIDFLQGQYPDFEVNRFKSRQFYCDHVNLMTATGGRSTGTNEMYDEDPSGNPIYNFTRLLKALDWVLAVDINATIVIGNTPLKMCSDSPIDFGAFDANTGVPSNYTKYFHYIANLTEAVKIHLGSNISRFDWRIMTEPDNHEWLQKELENYFPIYIHSVRAIKSVLPNATIELGNMVKADPKESLVPFIQRLQREAVDTIPDIVGYSGYGGGQFDHDERSIGKSDVMWHEALKNQLNLPHKRVMIQEGQILSDFEGIRLWNEDGTEFGAAWNAGVFHQCIINGIEKYTQWDFYAGEVRSPSLNVIEMFEKIENERMVKTDVIYPWYARYNQKRLNAFATIADGSDKVHLMVYFTDENHFSNKSMKITIQLKNVPQNISARNPLMFVVNRTMSNFFWTQYEQFGHIPRGYFTGATSKWDLNVGLTLNGTGYQTAFYEWAWNHRDDFKLENVTSPEFSNTNGIYKAELGFPANSVHLWEFTI